jgi:hypothetical protein
LPKVVVMLSWHLLVEDVSIKKFRKGIL